LLGDDAQTFKAKTLQAWTVCRKPILNSFIIFYISTAALFLSPQTPLRQKLLSPFWNFMEYTGLWQYYTVFVPPRFFNLYLEAKVELENGEVTTYKYPRMENLSLFEKMQKERYRKLFNDIANNPTDGVLWPDLARFAARSVYSKGGKRPVRVLLVRYWSDILPASGDPLPPVVTEYHSHGFFSFPIKPEELQE
jgi:hypothetical protein